MLGAFFVSKFQAFNRGSNLGTAITGACKLAQAHGIGLEEVLSFSRHSNVNTLMIYRDKERDVQGKISDLLSQLEVFNK